MTEWLLRRIVQSIFVILAMTVIVFIGVNVIGNPVDIMVSPDATAAERARIVTSLGLDKSLWQQYFIFLADAARGNFGNSFAINQPALPTIIGRMPATLELAVLAVLISLFVGIPLGLLAGVKKNSLLSKAVMAGSTAGFSLPTFWVGILLIMCFSVKLGWLPSSGRGETAPLFGVEFSFMTLDGLKHLILPSITLALFQTALLIRLVRASVEEVLPQDYMKFARAKGLGPKRLVFIHLLKNIMIPVVTLVGIEFASTIAFAMVTEAIFSWPGMGKLIIDSIYLLDRPVIITYLMLITLLFVTINLVVDIVYTILDPRIRIGAEG